MMRKIYTSLMLLTMLMVSMVAKAQYTAVINSDPVEGYVAGQQSFDATEIATALGLADNAALKTLVQNPNDKGEIQGGALYLKVGEDKSNAYTGNVNEWWMNLEGAPQGYSAEGTSWFVGLEFEDGNAAPEEGEPWADRINVYVGQMPGVFAKIYEASELKATIYLVNGDKEVSFDVTQNVTAAVKANVPDPTTDLSQLTIVKDYELKLPFTVGKQYEGKEISATFEDIYTALGVEDVKSYEAAIADFSFVQGGTSVETAEGSGEYVFTPAENLQLANVTDGWIGRYTSYDEDAGTETTLPMNYAKYYGEGCTFYLQKFTLAEGAFSLTTGQYPSTLKADDTDWTYLYLIYGDKAARIKVQVEVTKPESVPFEQMTKAGEITVPVKVEKAESGYPVTAFSFDMDPIIEALGVESSDIDEFYAWASEGDLSNNHTEGSAGYYMSADGYIDTWGNMAPIFVRPTSLANGEYEIGQYAATDYIKNITEDVVWKAQFLLLGIDKYYVVNLEATIGLPEASDASPDDEFGEIVATLPLVYEVKPYSGGEYFGSYSEEALADYVFDLNIESIKTLVGEGTYVLYGLKAPSTAESQPTVVAAKQSDYSQRSASGFDGGCWMSLAPESLGDEYQNVAYQGVWSGSPYGLEWDLDEGKFGIAQIPDARAVGDTYTSTFYWSLSDKSKAIKYLLTVKFVEEPNNSGSSATIVGSIDKMIEESEAEDGFSVQALVLEALGIDESEWESVVPKVANSAATYATVEDGFSDLMRDGAIYTLADGQEAPEDCYYITYEDDAIELDPMEIPFATGDESKAVIKMAFDYTDTENVTSRVLFTLTVVSENSPLLNINGIGTAQNGKATYYTLQGTPLTAPVKGLAVKKVGNQAEVIYVK